MKRIFATCLLAVAVALGASAQNAGDVLLARVPGVVNGVGTVIMAFLPGMMMKYVSPALGRFF